MFRDSASASTENMACYLNQNDITRESQLGILLDNLKEFQEDDLLLKAVELHLESSILGMTTQLTADRGNNWGRLADAYDMNKECYYE